MLRDAAKIINNTYKGQFPIETQEIQKLPGIGPYTARAIISFAYNRPEVFVETNIRTVFFHHMDEIARRRIAISDTELMPLVADALKRSRMEPREFYAMLMDYGSFLKKSGVRLNTKSKHYAKQSRFEGSRRQLRGQILTILLEKPLTETAMIYHSARTQKEVRGELIRLQKEKLITFKNKKYYIST
jgi:A/G-specific adenine glycosylase